MIKENINTEFKPCKLDDLAINTLAIMEEYKIKFQNDYNQIIRLILYCYYSDKDVLGKLNLKNDPPFPDGNKSPMNLTLKLFSHSSRKLRSKQKSEWKTERK